MGLQNFNFFNVHLNGDGTIQDVFEDSVVKGEVRFLPSRERMFTTTFFTVAELRATPDQNKIFYGNFTLFFQSLGRIYFDKCAFNCAFIYLHLYGQYNTQFRLNTFFTFYIWYVQVTQKIRFSFS